MSEKEKPQKYCPMTMNMSLGGNTCIGKSCAWWNFLDDECSVKTLGELASLKIPHR